MIKSLYARMLLAALVAVGVAAPHVMAQAHLALAPATTPKAMVADQILLLAQSALMGEGELREDQIIRTRILLDLALAANPEDIELLRLRSELARLEKDRESQLNVLRQYIRRVPGDDAAQLEVIFMALANGQTLDQRLASAVHMLDGPAGQQLPPAAQSRLASFIASGFHELGQTEEFGKRLAQALRLDSSNIAAARMAYELAVSRNSAKPDIAQALLNLVRANPIDAATRHRFGQALLDIGLGAHAATQFNAALVMSSQAMDEGFYRDWVAALILAGQLDEANRLLDDLAQVYARAGQQQQPGDQAAAEPAIGSLPVGLAVLRLVMLETPEAAQSNPEAGEAFNAVYNALKIAADGGDDDAASRMALLSLICRRRVESVTPYVEAMTAKLGAHDPRAQVLQAWQLFRKGDVEAAKPLLAESAARDPYGSYLVVLLGDVTEPRRQAVLRQIVLQDPASLLGLIAARTLSRAGGSLEPDRPATRISAQLDRWPGYLRVPNTQIQPWVTLQLTVEPQRFGYLEPMTAKIVLRNRTDLPLSIGDPTGQSVLPRNALMLVSLRQTDQNAPRIAPMVVDLGRRIRIEPQGTIEVTQRIDRAVLGALLSGLPSQNVSFSVTAIYDAQPGVDPLQGRTGMLGAIDKVNLVQVMGLPITAPNVDQWLAQLAEKGTVERYQALARLTIIASRLPPEGEGETLAKKIADALAQDIAQWPAQDQAWVARFVGNDEVSRNRLAAVHAAVTQSEDPLVRIIYLATHADSADSPLITEAMQVRDPNVISFARALQIGLRAAPASANAATTP